MVNVVVDDVVVVIVVVMVVQVVVDMLVDVPVLRRLALYRGPGCYNVTTCTLHFLCSYVYMRVCVCMRWPSLHVNPLMFGITDDGKRKWHGKTATPQQR